MRIRKENEHDNDDDSKKENIRSKGSTPAEWLTARKGAVSARRRSSRGCAMSSAGSGAQLPWEKSRKEIRIRRPSGKETLADLFDDGAS